MEQIVQLNSQAKLSEHFVLGEFTKSGSHPEVYNIPSHEAIANLKRLCGWLEELRKRYNERYVLDQTTPGPSRSAMPLGSSKNSGGEPNTTVLPLSRGSQRGSEQSNTITREIGSHQAHVMIGTKAYDIHHPMRIAL